MSVREAATAAAAAEAANTSSGDESGDEDTANAQATSGKKGKYRREKPWDNDSIDHWNVAEWTEDDGKKMGSLLEESSFATLFPQ